MHVIGDPGHRDTGVGGIGYLHHLEAVVLGGHHHRVVYRIPGPAKISTSYAPDQRRVCTDVSSVMLATGMRSAGSVRLSTCRPSSLDETTTAYVSDPIRMVSTATTPSSATVCRRRRYEPPAWGRPGRSG